MTYKQIEAAREIRLWLEHLIIPVAVTAIVVATNPKLKNKISGLFSKNEEITIG